MCGRTGISSLTSYLGQIEWIPSELFGLVFSHDLDFERPRREVASGYRVEQVFLGVVGVRAWQSISLVNWQILDALVSLVDGINSKLKVFPRACKSRSPYFQVEFAVKVFILVVDQLECVRSVAIHVPVAIRNTPIREQEADLVCRLRSQRNKVPEHVLVLQVGLRISLLGMNEARKLKPVWFERSFCSWSPDRRSLTSIGSLMKKMGVLLPTRSQTPSSL